MKDRCNGWTNYATWLVNLEIVNDRLDDLARDKSCDFRDEREIADYIREYVWETVLGGVDTTCGSAGYYAAVYLNQVNYDEIASHWTDELIASDDESEEED